MPENYSTSDLWLAATFLSEGKAILVDTQVSRNGRETVFFSFEGECLSKLAQSYCSNEALANVTRLRAKINDLRDVIFRARKR